MRPPSVSGSIDEGSAQPLSLASFLQTLGLGTAEVPEQTSVGAAEGGGGAVTLSTVHKAKGLEWRVVWVRCAPLAVARSLRVVRIVMSSNLLP